MVLALLVLIAGQTVTCLLWWALIRSFGAYVQMMKQVGDQNIMLQIDNARIAQQLAAVHDDLLTRARESA